MPTGIIRVNEDGGVSDLIRLLNKFCEGFFSPGDERFTFFFCGGFGDEANNRLGV